MRITTPASIKSLTEALISSFSPGVLCYIFDFFSLGTSTSKDFHLAFLTIIVFVPQVRGQLWIEQLLVVQCFYSSYAGEIIGWI